MNTKLDITAENLTLINTILQKHLPPLSIVWVFGSRAKGNAKKFSDLDLLFDLNGKPLSLDLLAILSSEFEESDLPYKVDIVDWNTIDTNFKKNIGARIKLDI